MQENFIERQFPVDISYGSSGGPEYYTEVLSTVNGYEIRNNKMYNPRMRFNVATGIKNRTQMEQMMKFFRNCKGRTLGFRYKDWSDFRGKNEKVQVLDRNSLQLIKTYRLDDDIADERIINKPIKNTVKIFVAGKQLPEKQVSIDYTTGRVLLLQSEASDDITADFEFDVPVRFDTDYLPVVIENNSFFSLPEIPIIEIKTL